MAPTPSTTPPDVRLKRFLHYGREVPVFICGYHDFHEYIEMKNLSAIEELLADSPEEKQADIVNHIVKAAIDGYVAYPNCLAFALAVCARQRVSEKLRHAAYAALATVCKTPLELFEFVNFAHKLTTGSKGWGYGIRNAISNWYLNRDPMEFAEFVTKYRGFLNWTHRDLVRLVHPKSEEPDKALILEYIARGFKHAEPNASQDEKAQKILQYLKRIEEFKHNSDPQTAANLITIYGYSVELVPPHNGLIKSQEVWLSLLRVLPLPDILENIKRLSCYGFLKPGQPIENILFERFQDEAAIKSSNLHPFEVYLVIRKYEEHARDQAQRMSYLVKCGRLSRLVKPAAKPNRNIITSMNSLLNATFQSVVPTGLRYLVAIDLTMKNSNRVAGAPFVTPLQAAVLFTMTLLRTEKNVMVVSFPVHDNTNTPPIDRSTFLPVIAEVMEPLEIDPNIGVQENVEKLKQVACGPAHVKQPMLWAKKVRIPADVIIILSMTSLGVEYTDTLVDYRATMNLPDTKLILHHLSAMLIRAEDTDTGVFHVGGFGGKVGKVIQAFCRGFF